MIQSYFGREFHVTLVDGEDDQDCFPLEIQGPIPTWVEIHLQYHSMLNPVCKRVETSGVA